MMRLSRQEAWAPSCLSFLSLLQHPHPYDVPCRIGGEFRRVHGLYGRRADAEGAGEIGVQAIFERVFPRRQALDEEVGGAVVGLLVPGDAEAPTPAGTRGSGLEAGRARIA